MKIVADDKIPFLRGVFEDVARVVYLPGAKTAAADVRDADALITRTRTRCGRELLAGSSVRFIATATIGFDHIDREALRELGIAWCNAPGCNAASVAQYITSALVSFPGSRQGQVLGVIGVGHVGRLVAAAGRALGMEVLLNDPPREEAGDPEHFVSLDEIREKSDFITLHVPLEREGAHPTLKMLSAAFFAGVKSGAVFFNSSRGEAVETSALKAALRGGRLAAAVIDVWENEPGIDTELMALARFATPHIAGYSTDGKANGTAMSVRRVAAALELPGFDGWYPASIPAPEAPEIIRLDASESVAGQVRQAVLHAYDISCDDRRLRAAPEDFEKLRGSYPVRREFPFFRVRGGSPEALKILTSLGFSADGGER
ncbi:MAG: 4-phosphoerythronate dehydrogenase [Lentisphaeria bacterium]|nr:4-phosphoerythronate dehydrogenase [Lentisphaeria bacterium]